jgi:hypothetical protein
LKNLAARGLLLPTLADWAKEVRLVGNIGAHFDPMDTVSKDDAEKLNTSCGNFCGTSTNCQQNWRGANGRNFWAVFYTPALPAGLGDVLTAVCCFLLTDEGSGLWPGDPQKRRLV